MLALPSGATQKFVAPNYVLDAVVGSMGVTARFPAARQSATVTHTFSLPASDLQYGGEGTNAGWAWAALRRFESPVLAPSGAMKNSADLRNWCEEITCEVTIAYRGGVRAVDVVVQEVPFGCARSINVDAASTYSSPLAVVAGGQAPGVCRPSIR